MANPIFYKDIVALDKTAHKDLRLRAPERPLAFAKGAQLIPAVVDEFDLAMSETVIAFLPAQPNPAAVFVCSLSAGENSYVNDAGLWEARYVPAYLRRYPFIVGDAKEGEAWLCIDQSYEGFGTQEGERLFDEEGQAQAPVDRGLSLAQSYRDAARRTDAFAALLSELDLFRSVTLNATSGGGEKSSLHGLMVVDEEALAALDGTGLARLHGQGFLKPLYAHLFSLKAVQRLGSRTPAGATEEQDKLVDEVAPAQ